MLSLTKEKNKQSWIPSILLLLMCQAEKGSLEDRDIIPVLELEQPMPFTAYVEQDWSRSVIFKGRNRTE